MRRIGMKAGRWLIVAATCMLPMQGFAATGQNQVISISIKPADGTSSQNVLTGSGVKTGHIQDGAVTDAKIGGTISTSKLSVGTAPNTVAAGNHTHVIGTAELATNAVATGNLIDGAVTSSKLATGAIGPDALAGASVTSQKLAPGSVTASAISAGAITSDLIGGAISVDKLAVFANVKVVHKGSADGVNTFNSIQSAIDWITLNDPHVITPTSWDEEMVSKVIYVMPGLYTENLAIPNGIHLKGSGRYTTIIAPAVSGPVISYINAVQNYSTGVISDIGIQGEVVGNVQHLRLDNTNISALSLTSQWNIYGTQIHANSSNLGTFTEHKNVSLTAKYCEFSFVPDLTWRSIHNFYYSTICGPADFTASSVVMYCNNGVNIIPNNP